MKEMKQVTHLFFGLFLSFLLVCRSGMVSFAAAAESIDPDMTGSISLTIRDMDGNSVATDGRAAVYRVADLSSDRSSWVCTDAFAGFGENPEYLYSSELAAVLADYADMNHIAADVTEVITDGSVSFSDLSVGAYLVVQIEPSTGFYSISPFLVTIPLESGNGWIYQVDCTPKIQISPIPDEPGIPEETEEPAEPPVTSGTFGSGNSALPQTGQLNWPIPILAVFGIFSFMAGVVLRRISDEK